MGSPRLRVVSEVADRCTVKQLSSLRLVASAVVWLLWFISRQSYTFLVTVCFYFQLPVCNLDNMLAALCCRYYLFASLVLWKGPSRKRAWGLSLSVQVQDKFAQQTDVSYAYSSLPGYTLAPQSPLRVGITSFLSYTGQTLQAP
jgi:hypothetical protein